MYQSRWQPARLEVQTVRCPYCGAFPGSSCVGARGKTRIANHADRVNAFMHASVVQVGQVWRSKDKRDDGLTVTVLDAGSPVPRADDFVLVQRLRKSWMRKTTLLSRYELVR